MVGREDGVGERVLVEFGIFVFMCVHIYIYIQDFIIPFYKSVSIYGAVPQAPLPQECIKGRLVVGCILLVMFL